MSNELYSSKGSAGLLSTNPRSRPRFFSRGRQSLLVVVLGALLVVDHFYPHVLHSDLTSLYSPAPLPSPSPSLVVVPDAEDSPPTPIISTTLLEQITSSLDQQKIALEAETELQDLAGYADRVKALLRLQEVAEHLATLPHSPRSIAGTDQDVGFYRESIQRHHDKLFAKLFPYVNRSKKSPRTFTDLKREFTHDRGIVIPCGNDQFQMAVHLIATLKHVHKTPMPIQVVYSGPGDLDQTKRAAFRAISPDVETVDLINFFDEEEVHIENSGWAIKAFAMLAAPYREVIICDADAIFLQKPEVLFDFPTYTATGTLFFRDREIFPGEGDVHRWWAKIMEGRTPSEEMLKSRFYKTDSREEMESGVVVIDKGRREPLMGLIMTAWLNTRKLRDAVTYQFTYGDKESFWMAYELIGLPYAFSSVEYASLIGQLTHPDTHAHSLNSRICSDHLFHLDHKKRPLWFNGSLFQEKGKKFKGWFFATHWAEGTGDWDCDPQPWCMKSIREVDVHKLSDGGYDRVLTDMVGAALYWEVQFEGLLERHI